MGMGLDLIAANTGFSFETLTIIVIYLATFIFYAKDFRLGSLLHAVTMMALTVWFYEQEMVWQMPLIIMIAHIIVLAFTIFSLARQGRAGGQLI